MWTPLREISRTQPVALVHGKKGRFDALFVRFWCVRSAFLEQINLISPPTASCISAIVVLVTCRSSQHPVHNMVPPQTPVQQQNGPSSRLPQPSPAHIRGAPVAARSSNRSIVQQSTSQFVTNGDPVLTAPASSSNSRQSTDRLVTVPAAPTVGDNQETTTWAGPSSSTTTPQ
jgi:hypothetical protein